MYTLSLSIVSWRYLDEWDAMRLLFRMVKQRQRRRACPAIHLYADLREPAAPEKPFTRKEVANWSGEKLGVIKKHDIQRQTELMLFRQLAIHLFLFWS